MADAISPADSVKHPLSIRDVYGLAKQNFNVRNGFIWGVNGSGQLGQNDRTHRSSPTQIMGDGNWTMIWGPGNNASLGVKIDGSLWMWGDNSPGTLGQNDRVNRSSPVQIPGDSWTPQGIMAPGQTMEKGGYYQSNWNSMARSDGTLWAWGHHSNGTLGINTMGYRSSPVQVAIPTGMKFNQFMTSEYTTVGIASTDKSLWGWGKGSDGQFMNQARYDRSSPAQFHSGTWDKIGMGDRHVVGIKTDGTLWAWGYNDYGQLGFNDQVPRSSPNQITSNTDWEDVSCGQEHSMAYRNGSLYAWGRGSEGQLGLGNNNHYSSPHQVGYNNGMWAKSKGLGNLQCRSYSSFCNMDKENPNSWLGWGSDSYYNLAAPTPNGSTFNRSTPVAVGPYFTFGSYQYGAQTDDVYNNPNQPRWDFITWYQAGEGGSLVNKM